MTPEIAAGRFFRGILLGLGLGLWYGFLRPLGHRHRHLADGLFVLGLLPVSIYFAFAVCEGDLNLGYFSGLLVGGVLWEWTVGRFLRPLWRGFWRIIGRFFRFFKKFFQKILYFLKKLFASAKKWSTIKWKKHDHPGGRKNGSSEKQA